MDNLKAQSSGIADDTGTVASEAGRHSRGGHFPSSRPAKSTFARATCQRGAAHNLKKSKRNFRPKERLQRLGEVGGNAEFDGVVPTFQVGQERNGDGLQLGLYEPSS